MHITDNTYTETDKIQTIHTQQNTCTETHKIHTHKTHIQYTQHIYTIHTPHTLVWVSLVNMKQSGTNFFQTLKQLGSLLPRFKSRQFGAEPHVHMDIK